MISIKHPPSLELDINTDFTQCGELLDYIIVLLKYLSILDTFFVNSTIYYTKCKDRL